MDIKLLVRIGLASEIRLHHHVVGLGRRRHVGLFLVSSGDVIVWQPVDDDRHQEGECQGEFLPEDSALRALVTPGETAIVFAVITGFLLPPIQNVPFRGRRQAVAGGGGLISGNHDVVIVRGVGAERSGIGRRGDQEAFGHDGEVRPLERGQDGRPARLGQARVGRGSIR